MTCEGLRCNVGGWGGRRSVRAERGSVRVGFRIAVNGNVSVDISQSLPAGLHLLQLQNPAGPLGEELPFCVGVKANCNS